MDNEFDYYNIDEISRETAQNQHYEFDENAWLKMQVLLDNQKDKKTGFWNWKNAFWVLLILSTSSVGYLLWGSNSNRNKALVHSLQTTSSNANQRNIKTSNHAIPNLNEEQQIDKNSNKLIARKSKEKNNIKYSGLTIIDAKNNNIENIDDQIIVLENELTKTNSGLKRKKSKNAVNYSEKADIDNTTNENEISFNNTIIDNSKQNKPTDITQKPSNTKTNVVNNLQSAASQTPNNQVNPVHQKQTVAKVKQNKLYISNMVSAEFSTVKFEYANTWTGNNHLSVGVNLNRKLGIELGWSNGTKVYKTSKEYYKATSNWYYSHFDTVNIHANCKVSEFPIRAKYYVQNNSSNSIYFTLGAILSKMEKENYDIRYFDRGVEKLRSREYNTSSNYNFNAATIAFGYQHKILHKTYFVAETFVNTPLTGVGNGKIRFTTLGAKIGLYFSPF